ncbi:MAG: glycosyltransferase family 1 protein [Chitinophagaceae bacterium]|nr:MAG: glycosyltransferase family 1 protein [Chitinophagaceae bacterium]
MTHKLHIVCLDAPAPPDYGGAIDMYYKVKALAESGRTIVLHYFGYKEGRDAHGLEPFCSAIHRYERKSFLSSIWEKQPYITGSRNNPELLKRLQQDKAPILLEGIHCAGLLPYLYGKRKLLLRMHNDEAAYYAALAANEQRLLRKTYFRVEGRLLHSFQARLPKDLPMACVSHTDMEQLHERYGFTHLDFIPSFTPWQLISGADGRGQYCLYQGNLEVSENREAALWLLEKVFAGTSLPFVIAGKGVPDSLRVAAAAMSNVRLVNNPSDTEMETLVREAQVHVLPSFNTTGLKLKMLHALCCGRHCLTNAAGIAGTVFDGAVELAESPEEFRSTLLRLWEQPFSAEMRDRRQIVKETYSNERNAARLNAWL